VPVASGIVTVFKGNSHNIFLNALVGLQHIMHPRRCGIPSGAIIPERVIQHHRKAKGRYREIGTVPSDNR